MLLLEFIDTAWTVKDVFNDQYNYNDLSEVEKYYKEPHFSLSHQK